MHCVLGVQITLGLSHLCVGLGTAANRGGAVCVCVQGLQDTCRDINEVVVTLCNQGMTTEGVPVPVLQD